MSASTQSGNHTVLLALPAAAAALCGSRTRPLGLSVEDTVSVQDGASLW